MIHADKFTPVDSTLIPTGELKPVDGTPFDFRTPTAIGARIDQDDEQLKFGGGYDHNWVINKPMGELALMARVYEPTTGRVLEVLSHRAGPAVLHRQLPGRQASPARAAGSTSSAMRSAWSRSIIPDSPNQPEFPSVVLKPGQVYHNTIIFQVLGSALSVVDQQVSITPVGCVTRNDE